MSKVGIYFILRFSSLFFGQDDGAAAGFADTWLTIGGLATIAYGLIGVLSSKTLTRVAGYYVLISSGTLLAAIGTGSAVVWAAALFYLVSSTLALSAFYLIIEPVERGESDDPALAVTAPVFEDEYVGVFEEEEDEFGVAIPATIAILGGGFIRSEEHTSELQSLMRISYAVFCLNKKKPTQTITTPNTSKTITKQQSNTKHTDTINM